jgi:hypothetical protein
MQPAKLTESLLFAFCLQLELRKLAWRPEGQELQTMLQKPVIQKLGQMLRGLFPFVNSSDFLRVIFIVGHSLLGLLNDYSI